jgi:ADP-heptose:LPS heptosyltransferase
VDHLLLDRWFHSRMRDLRAEFRLIRRIRATGYDLAICDASETSASHGFAALLTGAPTRIGFSANSRGFLYTSQLPMHPESNIIEDDLAIAVSLGADSVSRDVQCYFDDRDVQYARRLIPMHDHKSLIAIHAASNWQSKTWVPERWASVIDTLVLRYDAAVIFVGTAGEREYIDGIRALMRTTAVSAAGRTSLAQLGALLSQCHLFIGTDSGPRHIAAGTGRPQVTLMSSQDYPSRWDFRRPRETILRTDPTCSPCFQSFCSHRRCMVEISEQMVLDACHEMLTSTNEDDLTYRSCYAGSSPDQARNLDTETR